jgi:hypothetical protein
LRLALTFFIHAFRFALPGAPILPHFFPFFFLDFFFEPFLATDYTYKKNNSLIG